MNDIDYNKEQSFEQHRAIIGDRHFVLANPEKTDIWALPGCCPPVRNKFGRIIEKAKFLTATTKQLRQLALDQHKKLVLINDYPVTRK